ncbi:murein biosynthesis integral membrane protein MurJ [Parasphingorhabdus sp. DH2-15]|uniref:murein biosynthesis integral membrane protein MurJ n=1 Tax=Parasphingorhabdus sp. DH2-15 TaxID=3444112 RepID=UPI003F68246C
MNLLKATGTIGGLTMVSRLFGFVRDILIARILGAGLAADAWQLAFQMPNIFRRLFAEGAFSIAFVPLFNGKLAEDEANAKLGDTSRKTSAAQKFATEVLSIFVPVLVFFTIIMMLAMPWIIWLFDDFGQGGRSGDYSVTLARIAFPYLALISITTLFSGILNSLSRFAAAAFAPVLLNICMITALIYSLIEDGGTNPRQTAYYLAFAVATSGLLQMLWLYYWARRAGFRFPIKLPRLTQDVRELGMLILPATFGAGIYQISRAVDLFFLGQLNEGSFSIMAYADRLNQLPLGIIGIALGTAILPALSRFIAKADHKGASHLQSNAIELAMLLTLPASFALFVLSCPLVAAFFVGGNFTVGNATIAGAVLSTLVVGLPAYVLIKVLVPGFFARKDTRTPVITAGISLVINIILNIVLIPILGIAGVALAGAVSAWSNTIMLYAMLHYRAHYRIPMALILRLARITLSAAFMAGVLRFILPYGLPYYTGDTLERVISIAALVVIGGIAYLLTALISGAISRERIAILMKGRSGSADNSPEPSQTGNG